MNDETISYEETCLRMGADAEVSRLREERNEARRVAKSYFDRVILTYRVSLGDADALALYSRWVEEIPWLGENDE